jgi:hypothetical protein
MWASVSPCRLVLLLPGGSAGRRRGRAGWDGRPESLGRGRGHALPGLRCRAARRCRREPRAGADAAKGRGCERRSLQGRHTSNKDKRVINQGIVGGSRGGGHPL